MLYSNKLKWIIYKIDLHLTPILSEYIYYRALPRWRSPESRAIIIETAEEIRDIVDRKLHGDYSRIPKDMVKKEHDRCMEILRLNESSFCRINDEFIEMPEEWNDLKLIVSEEYMSKFFNDHPSSRG